jgi:hypothetical protein
LPVNGATRICGVVGGVTVGRSEQVVHERERKGEREKGRERETETETERDRERGGVA